jgi:hypothetical protein
MRLIIILFLSFVPNFLTQAQENEKYLKLKRKYNYREGYILDRDSLKIKGLIKENIQNETKKYSVVTFVQLNGKKSQYHPSEIKGFGYSIYDFVSDGSSFYEVIQSGKRVSLFKHVSVFRWSTPGAPGMAPAIGSTTDESLYVKRHNEVRFKEVRRRNFEVEFSAYFKDCKEIVDKIQTKEYTHKNIKQIVTTYNYCK